MNTFITEIPRQCITIDGVCYPASAASPTAENGRSALQEDFYGRYGKESFHASLADFLCEWFDGSDTLRVHTSGSTGTPKEMWVEKKRMMNSAQMTVSFLGLQAGDTAQLCMPLKYIAGKMVVVRALVAGLNLLPLAPCGHPLENISQVPVFSAMIPMQVFNSLQVPEEAERLAAIRHLIIGGGAIDEQVGKTLKDFPHAVWSTYGMTETLSHIALRRLNGKEASQWYTPFPGVQLSLSPDDTLIIHAPQVHPEPLVTNDIAVFNAEGQFRIAGRKDNTINTGGVKVQIEEVEKELAARLSVPFQITSVPDAKFGEAIVLLTETDNGCPDEVLQEAIHQLPRYWQPRHLVRIPALPLTETGKADRKTGRQRATEILQSRTGCSGK